MKRQVYKMTRIVLHRSGDLGQRFVDEVLKILNSCYERVGVHLEIVDIYIFAKSSMMNAFLNNEKRKLGIKTSIFEESFLATHDAWYGTPRIMIAHDKMLNAPKLVGIGALHHEAAHTMLHGSLEYYLFPIPLSLLELERRDVIPRQVARDLVYLVSLAVKDNEVTRLLYENGYVADQVAYNKYFLKPSEEELQAWTLAESNKIARLFLLVSLLKSACCATPLLNDKRYSEEISKAMTRSMSFLPAQWADRLLKILETTDKFGRNTHDNVDQFMKDVVNELFV